MLGKFLLAALCASIAVLLSALHVSAAVVLATNAANNITYNSATLNGILGSLGNDKSSTIYFEWGTSTNYGKTTSYQTHSTPSQISATITGLIPDTVYHYRMVAIPAVPGGVPSYGANVAFKTSPISTPPQPIPGPLPPVPPIPKPEVTVSTLPAGSLTLDSTNLNGQVVSMGIYRSVETWFDWGITPSLGNSTQRTQLMSVGLFSATLMGLAPGTTYYYCGAAIPTAVGALAVYGPQKTFTTPVLPVTRVITEPATDISQTGATLIGTVNFQGQYSNVQVWFEWGTSEAYSNTTIQRELSKSGSYSTHITGLVPGVPYYYRAVALLSTIGSMPVYGVGKYFTTPRNPGVFVNTDPESNIAATSVTLNGDVNSFGNRQAVEVWFEWGSTSAYVNSTPPQTQTTPSAFSTSLTGLTSGALYHYRAVTLPLTSGSAPLYGTDNTFITGVAPGLMVTTNQTVDIAASSATIRGTINSLGSNSSVQALFEWGTTSSYGNSTAPMQKMASGIFSTHITDLLPNTTYHYRAVEAPLLIGAQAAYGQDMTFTTNSIVNVSITTERASGISSISAILNGDISSLGDNKEVQVWFEWGTTPSYGSSISPLTYTYPTTFNNTVTGLNPGTSYHYRAVALIPGKGSKIYGYDQVFSIGKQPAPAPANNLFSLWILIMIIIAVLILILILVTVLRR